MAAARFSISRICLCWPARASKRAGEEGIGGERGVGAHSSAIHCTSISWNWRQFEEIETNNRHIACVTSIYLRARKNRQSSLSTTASSGQACGTAIRTAHTSTVGKSIEWKLTYPTIYHTCDTCGVDFDKTSKGCEDGETMRQNECSPPQDGPELAMSQHTLRACKRRTRAPGRSDASGAARDSEHSRKEER